MKTMKISILNPGDKNWSEQSTWVAIGCCRQKFQVMSIGGEVTGFACVQTWGVYQVVLHLFCFAFIDKFKERKESSRNKQNPSVSGPWYTSILEIVGPRNRSTSWTINHQLENAKMEQFMAEEFPANYKIFIIGHYKKCMSKVKRRARI